MRQILTFLCALAVMASCSTTRGGQARVGDGGNLHPDDVFTITEDDIARETRQINELIQGEWTYNGPAVDVSGKNLLAGIGKPIAKGTLKKKLKNAFKKIGLDKARPMFSLNTDGSCSIRMLYMSINGDYNYNPSQDQISIKWHGIPVNAHIKRDGKKKLHITFDTDKLLRLFSLASRVSDNSALKALSTLLDNYDDIMVGFELKK